MNKIYIVKKIIWNISQFFVCFIFLHYRGKHRVPKSKDIIAFPRKSPCIQIQRSYYIIETIIEFLNKNKFNYPDKHCVQKSEDIITLSRGVHILIYYYITETNTQCPYSNPEIYLHNGENHGVPKSVHFIKLSS